MPGRKFFELADVASQLKRRRSAAAISPIAAEAVNRIDRLFEVDRAVNGAAIAERLAVRREFAAPPVTDLEQWLRSQRAALARHNPVAGAIGYMLKDWAAFARLKIAGLPWRASASSSASMQNLASSEIDTRHAITRRVNQSTMATR